MTIPYDSEGNYHNPDGLVTDEQIAEWRAEKLAQLPPQETETLLPLLTIEIEEVCTSTICKDNHAPFVRYMGKPVENRTVEETRGL